MRKRKGSWTIKALVDGHMYHLTQDGRFVRVASKDPAGKFTREDVARYFADSGLAHLRLFAETVHIGEVQVIRTHF